MHMLIGISVLHNSSLFDPVSALFFCLAVEVYWVKFQMETPEENKNSFKNDRGERKHLEEFVY